MDPDYKMLMDPMELVTMGVVYLVHGGMVFVQTSLACFLLGTGAHSLLVPNLEGSWLRRLGVIVIGEPSARWSGAVRVGLGLLLFAPLLFGAPVAVSLLASLAAFGLLLALERGIPEFLAPSGRVIRRLAISFAAVAALFMLWEREDNLALGADLLVNAMESRNEEVAWQAEGDPEAPKVGDLAPDFELQDPSGEVRVRLSDFRGKRPVALVFGSYT